MGLASIPRQATRRWKIHCDIGTCETLPLTRYTANEVAQWFDKNYPQCSPHVVESREKRTWQQRKSQV